MNPLFLKLRVKEIIFLCSIFLQSASIKAGDTIPNTAFIEYCKASGAYMIYYYTDVTYRKAWEAYERITSVESKLVVNNKAGVDAYAFVNMEESVADHLRSIRVKTLKADGSIVRLDSSVIYKHLKKEENLDKRYPIPGVEPGDTIEVSYVYSEVLEDYESGDFVSLYGEIPSLNTEFSVSTPSDLQINYKSYNGFPDPIVYASDTLVYCLFKMERINGLKENQYTCMLCELPYIYYSIDKKGENSNRTWKQVYNQEFNVISQPIMLDSENSMYYSRWKNRVIGNADDSSKYYKLNLLMNDIYDHYKVVSFDGSEFLKSSGYFLKQMRFDPFSIRRLYRQILEDLQIKYWAVFARSRRLGNIDPYYIRKGEYDHIFFAYENAQGTISFLYPHEVDYNYRINELPTSLYSALAIIARPLASEKVKSSDKYINYDLELAEADSVTVDVIKLPGLGVNYNFAKQMFFCDMDLSKKNASFTSSYSLSGGLSTDIRKFLSALRQNKEMGDFYEALAKYEDDNTSLKIDSVTRMELKQNRPFVFTIGGTGKLEKNIGFISDSLMSINLDGMILHSQVQSEEDSADLNYYLDYSYTDFWQIILKFPCSVELVGYEGNSREFKNDFGAYFFSMSVVNANQLIIQSNYKVLKDMIPKNEYSQIKTLNAFVQDIKNMRILVKLKKAPA